MAEVAADRMTERVVSALHTEALLLADEARGYFDGIGRADRERLMPLMRVVFSCEALKVTTRLMHVVAWLLTRRASVRGDLGPVQSSLIRRPLGEATESDRDVVGDLPETARLFVAASQDLYDRVRRLEQEMGSPRQIASPARSLIDRLERSL